VLVERRDDQRIELPAGLPLQFAHRRLDGDLLAVGADGGERVEGVGAQPNSSWVAMMKMKASETFRFPSASTGTGRNSAASAKPKNTATPTSDFAVGCVLAADTIAAASTGVPVATTAIAYRRDRDGSPTLTGEE